MLWISLVVQIAGVAIGLVVVWVAGGPDFWTWAEYLYDSDAVGVTPLLLRPKVPGLPSPVRPCQ